MSVLELKMDEVGYHRVSEVGGALPLFLGPQDCRIL